MLLLVRYLMIRIYIVKCVICIQEHNTLLLRFGKCSKKVKVMVFSAYCLYVYGTALWNTCRHTVNCMKKTEKLLSQMYKVVFGYVYFPKSSQGFPL